MRLTNVGMAGSKGFESVRRVCFLSGFFITIGMIFNCKNSPGYSDKGQATQADGVLLKTHFTITEYVASLYVLYAMMSRSILSMISRSILSMISRSILSYI